MSAEFTPGPWRVDDDLRQGMAWNRHIVDESGENRICFMSNTGERPEGFANARLIAAAPEGFGFAAAFLEHIRRSDLDDLDFGRGLQESGLIEQAKAFVIKARGEA